MSDYEPAPTPHHDSSSATYPPILYAESTLFWGLLGGVVCAALALIAISDPRFGGNLNAPLRLLFALLAAGVPATAIAGKLAVDLLAAKGFFVDTGDGIIRNVKQIERREPIRVSLERPILSEADIKALDAEKVAALPEPLEIRSMVWVHAEYFPFHIGGHDFAEMGGDGVDFYLLGCWVEKDRRVLQGMRPRRRPGELVAVPGEFAANGKFLKMRWRTWEVHWRWRNEVRGPAPAGAWLSSGPVLRPGRWECPALPANLLRYLETEDYTKNAGATEGHQKRTNWYGRVPKLYRQGFVRIAYSEFPRMDERGDFSRYVAEHEKTLVWGLQGNCVKFAEENAELMEKFSGVSLHAEIGHTALMGRQGGGESLGVGNQRP